MNTQLSDQELIALLERQSPDFAAEMSVAFQGLLDTCAKDNYEATVQDVVTMAGSMVRAKAASLANVIASAQIAKLVADLRAQGIKV